MEIKDKTSLKGHYRFIKHDLDGNTVSIEEYDNTICSVGREAIAYQISGDETYDLKATYIALGTSQVTPAEGDTTLGTESYRKAVSSHNASGDTASVAGFFAASDCTGHYYEAGVFCDGVATQASATTDSGLLLSHVAIDVDKSALESLTVEFYITIT